MTQDIKELISQFIHDDGRGEITGDTLQAVLLAMVDASSKSKGRFLGILSPTMPAPPIADGNDYYISLEPGQYFNGYFLRPHSVAFWRYGPHTRGVPDESSERMGWYIPSDAYYHENRQDRRVIMGKSIPINPEEGSVYLISLGSGDRSYISKKISGAGGNKRHNLFEYRGTRFGGVSNRFLLPINNEYPRLSDPLGLSPGEYDDWQEAVSAYIDTYATDLKPGKVIKSRTPKYIYNGEKVIFRPQSTNGLKVFYVRRKNHGRGGRLRKPWAPKGYAPLDPRDKYITYSTNKLEPVGSQISAQLIYSAYYRIRKKRGKNGNPIYRVRPLKRCDIFRKVVLIRKNKKTPIRATQTVQIPYTQIK